MTSFDDPARCRYCAAPMRWKRRSAVYCGSACRADASRLRRLLDGVPIDHYTSVEAFIATRHRRSVPATVPRSASERRDGARRASGGVGERAA